MMTHALPARILVLAHLAKMKQQGPVFAKTAQGISAEVGHSKSWVTIVLNQMNEQGLVSSSKPIIVGKNPLSGRQRPYVHEITREGIEALEKERGRT